LITRIDLSTFNKPDATYPNGIKFKHKPNIYILFIESLHSSKALKALYQINSQDFEDKITQKGLTIYENTYSNRTATATSFLSLVWPQLLYDSIHYIHDHNEYLPSAFSVLKSNGYRLNLYSSEHLIGNFPKLFHNTGAKFSPLGNKLERLFSPILSQNVLFRKALGTPDIFKAEEGFTEKFQAMQEQMQRHKEPQLHFIHYGSCRFYRALH